MADRPQMQAGFQRLLFSISLAPHFTRFPHSSHLLSLISGTLIYAELKRLSITVTVLPSYHFMKIDR